MLSVRKKRRKFLPEDLKTNSWRSVKPYARDVLNRPINSVKDFEKFLADDSEINTAVLDTFFELDIAMSMNMSAQNSRKYNAFVTNAYPQYVEYTQAVEKIIAESPYALKMKDPVFKMHKEFAEMQVKMYNPANSKLEGKDYEICMRASDVLSGLKVSHNGKSLTYEQLDAYYLSNDPKIRKAAGLAGMAAREKHAKRLDKIYTGARKLRHTMALNSGMTNYVDHVFWNTKEYSKDLLYRPRDCRRFHKDIADVVVPYVKKLDQMRMTRQGLTKLYPWDCDFRALPDMDGKERIRPYKTQAELCDKTERVLDAIDPFFGDVMRLMRKNNRIDLGLREDKASGAANYPGIASGIPFTYGTFTGTNEDFPTLIHEQGHAAHNVSMHLHLPYERYRSYGAEVCEFAAIGTEMLSYDHWDLFYDNKVDCLRSKRDFLEKIVRFFPYMAKIDAFQHEVYTHPEMSEKQVHKTYLELDKRFSSPLVDWTGHSKQRGMMWQRQGHIFTMPLYYIEYGMAYLGATQLLINARKNEKKTVKQFKEALSLGEKVSIPEVYETAGVKFDFSKEMLKSSMEFLWNEYQAVDAELTTLQTPQIGKAKEKYAA